MLQIKSRSILLLLEYWNFKADFEQHAYCRASEGVVRVNVEHVPLAAPGLDSETRVSGVYSTELAMQLDKAIHNTRAIDLEALCILAGRKASFLSCYSNFLLFSTCCTLLSMQLRQDSICFMPGVFFPFRGTSSRLGVTFNTARGKRGGGGSFQCFSRFPLLEMSNYRSPFAVNYVVWGIWAILLTNYKETWPGMENPIRCAVTGCMRKFDRCLLPLCHNSSYGFQVSHCFHFSICVSGSWCQELWLQKHHIYTLVIPE